MLKVVEIKNLTVKYPDVKALDNVSFEVNEGDFLGIIGPNGAGKSTFLKLLTALYYPQGGIIRVDGKALGEPLYQEWFEEKVFHKGCRHRSPHSLESTVHWF